MYTQGRSSFQRARLPSPPWAGSPLTKRGISPVIKGTATVNSDCTATGTISVYSLSGTLLRTAVLAGVFVNNQREVRYLFESLVLPNGTSIRAVITVDAKRVFTND